MLEFRIRVRVRVRVRRSAPFGITFFPTGNFPPKSDYIS